MPSNVRPVFSRSQFEYDAISATIAALRGGAVQIALRVKNQTGPWILAIFSGVETMKHDEGSGFRELENGSSGARAALLRGTVEVASSVPQQATRKERSFLSGETVKYGFDTGRRHLEDRSIAC